ncbi:MAG TPA: TonB-dependent receptor [Anaeromyxobacteraceae bacterium]|jgi:hypothetical protein
MKKKLLRLLRLAPLALLFAGQAFAQTTGTLVGVVTDLATGKPVEGAVVVATGPNLIGEQTAVSAKDGSYRIQLLPAGQYKLLVQLAGYKPFERSDIRLSADKTLRANLAVVPEAVQLEEQVVRTGIAPVINVGSAESGTVVSRDFIANIPVGRSFQAIAAVAAGAGNDQYGVAFSGGQSPENGYIVDGLNITDPSYGAAPGTWTNRTTPTLLSNFIQEVDVKTGSFMPEYGRATGGIVNVVTRSGSNEFHGEVWTNYRPDFLFQPKGKIIGSDGEGVAYYSKPADGAYNLDAGLAVGGPVMKDKLWFFAGFAPIVQKNYFDRFQRLTVVGGDAGAPAGCAAGSICRDSNGFALWNKVAGTDTKTHSGQTSYQWAGKLTYLANENNTVTVSTYGQPSTLTVWGTKQLPDATSNYDTQLTWYDFVGHYAGKFLSKRVIVEADLGYHGQKTKDDPTAYQSSHPAIRWNDPTAYYSLTAFEPVAGCSDVIHCQIRGYSTGGYGFTGDDTISRIAGKLSVGALFSAAGSHTAKVGIDLERNDYDKTKRYSGGILVSARGAVFRTVRGYAHILPTSPEPGVTDALADIVWDGSLKNQSYSNNNAYFLQDSWQVMNTGVTLNAGVRLETQEIKSKTQSLTKLSTTDSWAPRVQAIWDFTGTGRGKVSANWGRFYWAIPLDMGDRAFGVEREVSYRQRFGCFTGLPATAAASYNPATPQLYGNWDTANLVGAGGAPGCPNVVNTGAGTGADGFQAVGGYLFTQTGQGAEPVMPGLKASSVDMFGAQVEYELLSDLSVGIEYSGRRLGDIVEDMSPDDGNNYFIANPGRNVTWSDANGTYSGKTMPAFDSIGGRNLTVNFPKPTRDYDGLTLKVTKAYSRNWQAQASYTYSVLKGNYAGPYMDDYGGVGQGQLDPGITAAFDLPTLLWNVKGLLPGDHTHTLKLYGSYTWALGSRLSLTGGGGYTGRSGRPMTALGGHDLYGSGLAYIIQQGGAGRTPFTHQLDVRGAVSYVLRAPYELRFSIDVFNILNQQEALLYDQNYTFDQVQVIQGVKCNVQAVGTSNPIGKLQSSCPDVAFLKTINGLAVTPNANWGKPIASNLAYQVPVQVRFGLSLAF